MAQLKIICFFVWLCASMPLWALDLLKCPVLTTRNMCQLSVTQDPKMKIATKSRETLRGYCRNPKTQGFWNDYFKGTVIKEYGECTYNIPSQWLGTFVSAVVDGQLTIYRPLPKGFFSITRFEFNCPRLSYRDFKTLVQGYTIETADGYVWREKKKQSLQVGRFKFSSPIGRRDHIEATRRTIHRMCSYALDSNVSSNPIILKNIVTDEILSPSSEETAYSRNTAPLRGEKEG